MSVGLLEPRGRGGSLSTGAGQQDHASPWSSLARERCPSADVKQLGFKLVLLRVYL